jgi:hypothetical protein
MGSTGDAEPDSGIRSWLCRKDGNTEARLSHRELVM